MKNNDEKYFCNICHKNILIAEKRIHENVCGSSINNNISNSLPNLQSNNINIKETYICPICGDKINIQEKEKHIDFHSYNDFNINSETGNEDKFNDEGILVSRNTLSNYNSQELFEENNNSYNTNNSVYYDGFNSYSDDLNNKIIDINKIMEKLNVNIITDDINNFLDKNCVICQEEFKKGDNYIILPCMHLFHSNCIKEWINVKNKCPICNLDVN